MLSSLRLWLHSGWHGQHPTTRLIFLSSLFWNLGASAYAPLWPLYLEHLGATPAQLAAVFSIGFLAVSVSFLPGGWLADRFDRRTVAVTGWVIATPVPALYALAPDWRWVLPGVMVYYMTVAVMPALQAYTSTQVPQQQWGSAFAFLGAAMPLAYLVAPTLGGYLAQAAGTRAVFVFAFACFAVSTYWLWRLGPQPPPVRVQTGPFRAMRRGWSRRLVPAALGFSAMYLLVTLPAPFLSPYLKHQRGLAEGSIGLFNSVAAVGEIGAAFLIGRRADALGRGRAMALGLGLFGAAQLLLLAPGAVTPALALLVQGGQRVALSLTAAVTAGLGPPEDTGARFAVVGLLSGLAMAAASQVGAWLYGRGPALLFQAAGAGALAAAAILAWGSRPRHSPEDRSAARSA